MKRGILSFTIVLFAGWMAGAQALGVGEIELNSHLNQRLSAEIPLVETGELGAEDVLVSLGSPEDFERAGVERFFYLTDMRFEVFSDGRGPRIRITSREPVTEPYLNFIVEVLWSKGRMLKEFTILLDPPTYQAGVTTPVTAPPAPATVTRPPRQAPPESTRETETDVSYGADTRSDPGADYAPVREVPGDGVLTTGQTLWRIAERYRPAQDIKLNQYMLAIQQANPDAFINENINLLKAGYRLQMPDAEAARQLTAAQAAAEVAAQTASWRNEEQAPKVETEAVAAEDVATADDPGTPPASAEPDTSLAAQIDATPTATAPSDETDVAPAGSVGRLEIQADTESSGAAESPAANVTEAGLLEEKDRLEREIQELGYQSDREKELAAAQVAELSRQIEVKDQQLANLRAQFDAAQQQLAERGGQASPDQSQPATPWWQSTAMLIGGGLLLVLVLVAALLLARRRQQSAQDEAFQEAIIETQARESRVDPSVATTAAPVLAPVAPLAAVASATSATASDHDTFDFLDELGREDDDPLRAPSDKPEAGESPARQTGDVIGEADIYAAYGRYPHAIGLLLGALEEDPDRHDVRLKLLEVAVTANDGETFDKHIRELVNRCDDQDILLAARELEEGFSGTFEPDEVDDLLDEREIESAPASDEGEDLAMEDLLADSTTHQADDEFSLEIEDDTLTPLTFEPDTTLQESAGSATGFHDGSFNEPVEERPDLKSGDLSADEPPASEGAVLDDDYAAIASDDVPSTRADVLGGDLGIEFDEFDTDAPPTTQSAPEIARDPDKNAQTDDLNDDLDLDDLLSDLDDVPDAPKVSKEAVTDRPSTPEDFQFKRMDDDVPLLDTAESLSEDTGLDDDQGLEDLDDLLASLDEVEEGSKPDLDAAPRSAEILSFTRPKLDGGVRSGRAFEDDVEIDGADGDDGFDFGDAEDAAETKLDLAQAYIEMGDAEGAQDILNEVLSEGNQAQQALARSLLDSLAS